MKFNLSEFAWAVGIAVVVALLEPFVGFDPAKIAEPRTWIIGIAAGGIRAFAQATLGFIASKLVTKPA